ncbi:IgGFc-binding protein-like [Cololabis saira]|uniref:IgGFc-binding protein-like n=1 Tax=Cololabis saira TaxID=129043 RepID=UPI002AD338FF|nr:IgGFc-binding protein-like [Cololabis saira]
MLLPLLYLSSLVALTGAEAERPDASDTFPLPHTYDISSCPINYYGVVYDTLYVSTANGLVYFNFNGYYKLQTTKMLPRSFYDRMDATYGPGNVTFQISPRDVAIENKVRNTIPTLEGNMSCSVQTSYVSENGALITLFLVQYGTRTVLGIQTNSTNLRSYYYIAPYVNGEAEISISVSGGSDMNFKVNFMDISGCRTEAGDFISPGGEEDDDETCVTYSCSSDSVLKVEGCAENQHCDGDGTCTPNNICTLTGPTVINVHGHVTSVEDRCTYTLMSDNQLFSHFEVLASYQDRRRTDVSFLDSVTLKNTGVEVLLEQGGRVKVNGSLVSLNSSLQDFAGVELCKTQAGVTAKLQLDDWREVTVFFDGNTAQLQTLGGDYYPPGGLCGDSNTSSSIQTNSSSCQTHPETSDQTVHCPTMSQRCSVLMEEPFTSCHGSVTPEPYITACSDTMCNYPDEDGLLCQFLEAYARACSLVNIQLGEWRSNQHCCGYHGDTD